MGKMTEDTFNTLYKYGRIVYQGRMNTTEAADRAVEESPEVAKSSAMHYINWYSKMRDGEFLSWNTNGELLKYYIDRIVQEENNSAAELAIKAARKYAKYKNRQEFDKELIEYANNHGINLLDIDSSFEQNLEGDEGMEIRDYIGKIKQYILKAGFCYDQGMIENFYLCLKSKPFVILAGISGTGKTRLVKLFASAIGAKYKLVSVRPDWSDSSDLIGYTNLQGEYHPGAITNFIYEAISEPNKPYILCLDEMNLARVEYYFSDFLSLIETRKWSDKRIMTDTISLPDEAKKKYGDFYIPDNLYFVGTVNMDETTYPFSKKVLDRANTIEFSEVNLVPSYSEIKGEAMPITLDNSFLKSKYLSLVVDTNEKQRIAVIEISKELQNINEKLRDANLHVGYRVRDEIVFYILNNFEADLLEYEEAMDFEIMQKILPRIQGSSAGIKNLLIALFKMFAGDYSAFSQDLVWKQMEDYLKTTTPLYPKSAEKICYMMRRFEEDGFTSYWL